ncbi:MAG: LysR family transcriptional regulator [Bosea sp.]|uniref:LysR family transcriptional regulator n=1 Tax=Bosea sp. (in: a-proteobacteria) TaxID=1871050 RepID=UPI001AD34CBC|nr:LysR family transcriptional regulator [Bosea sp. (in: a-proteobacteria)]MBN9468022.1 LysR family transcriptional regulator [Bosea sp. (in: a-proteobacteria)]
MISHKQMEAIYWVNKLGTFHAAARHLNISQSTASKRVQECETILGREIFDRTTRHVELTPTGRSIIGLVDQSLHLQDEIRQLARSPDQFAGRFKFGATEMIAVSWLPKLVSAIKEAYPKVVLEPVIDDAWTLFSGLRDRSLDLVLTPRLRGELDLPYVPLGDVATSWMCSHSLYAGPDMLPIERIVEFPVLIQSEKSSIYDLLAAWFNEHNVSINRTIICNHTSAVAELAKAGFGMACLPTNYFLPQVASGALRIIWTTPPPPSLRFVAAYRNDRMAPICARIAEMARQQHDFAPPAEG